ncbi:MAG: YbaB/EbfC family nucleoid-associated protein [Actinobacteria bacterium]|nr:YbaB/EbfC family nucleoid-associated protein [Actinomycetota bacterium]
MKNMGGLIKQAQKMQKEMERVSANLANIQVEGTAGGGMVTVTANAAQELKEIKIDPEVVDPEDVEMLEDLVLAAVNQALENAKSKAEEEMSQVTGGLPNMMGGMKFPGF